MIKKEIPKASLDTLTRFTLEQEVEQSSDWEGHIFYANLIEDPEGTLVHYSSAKRFLDKAIEEKDKEIEELKMQIPQYQLEALQKRLDAHIEGKCEYCGEKVASYKSPEGAFAPEAWATMRDRGIDPSTGHKKSCKRTKRTR